MAIAKHFSTGDVESRFDAGDWLETPPGALALQSAAATPDCVLAGDIRISTHLIFLGRAEHVLRRSGHAVLTYADGHYGQTMRLPCPPVVRMLLHSSRRCSGPTGCDALIDESHGLDTTAGHIATNTLPKRMLPEWIATATALRRPEPINVRFLSEIVYHRNRAGHGGSAVAQKA